ncbi:MAG TPA: hypothetical protein VGO58_14660 [Chitinophagaceae bacterium]|jgi:hypothetical protein|nr:hypothetical protein [Chitinophagaceae bacterium]
MRKLFFSISFFLVFQVIHAQNVGIGTITPDASAQLDISSTTKGLLTPRMTDAEMNAIVSPATGLFVFNTDSSRFYTYTGVTWIKLILSTDIFFKAASNGLDIYNTNSRNVGIGTALPSSLLHANGGNFLVTGTQGSGNAIEVSGIGTRMFFNTSKAAFRAGYSGGSNWDNSNIGNYSVALGYNPEAFGEKSIAMGTDANARNENAIAIGNSTYASGFGSIALGNDATAIGDYSAALGSGTYAFRANSVALGSNIQAWSYAEVVIGSFNKSYTPNNSNGWNSEDRILTVANGSSQAARSDAMVVLKNGNVGIGATSPSSLLHINNSSGPVAVTIQSSTSNASLDIYAGASGMESGISAYTGSSKRWSFGKSNTTESGSETGSDFFINRYDDAGAYAGRPFLIKRSTGNTGFGGINDPLQKVDVNGNINISSGSGYFIGNTKVLSITGVNNLFAGASAGILTTGSNNVLLGYGAGLNVGSNNVMIGSGAGGAETGNNKLYIDNSNTHLPLIYGDFSKDSLSVNGSLNIEGALGLKVKTTQVAGINHPDATGGIWIYSNGTGTIDLSSAAYSDRLLIILNNTGATRTISSYRDLANTSVTVINNNVSLWLVYDGTNWRQIK